MSLDSRMQPPSASSPRPVPQSLTVRWVRRSAVTAGALVLAATGAGAAYLGSVNHNIQRADLLTVSAAAAPQSARGAVNILIMGAAPNADETKTGAGDVVMMLHLSADRKSAQLVSFPRVTSVKVAGHHEQPLNMTYSLGGTTLTVKTVEQLTKTRIDHVMMVGYQGFGALIKEVGAITVSNPTSFSNGGFSFDEGTISLNETQAMAYVQPRTDGKDGLGDREERQRVVLEATLKQGLNRDLLSSPAKLVSFINTASNHVTVDRAFTSSAITKLALSMKLTDKTLSLVRAPLSDKTTVVDGKTVRGVDPVQFKALTKALSKDQVPDYLAKYPTS